MAKDEITLLTAAGTAIPVLIFSVVRLSIVIAAAEALGLNAQQTTGLIVALYAIPGLLSLALVTFTRIPLLIGWSTPGIVFLASVGDQIPYSAVLGSMIAAGLVIALLAVAGLIPLVQRLVPAPIVFGLLAGMVLPFVVRIFSDLGSETLVLGAVLVGFLVGRRWLEPKIPALVVALVAGLTAAAAGGRLAGPTSTLSFPVPELIVPSFSLAAIVTIVPVVVIVISIQGNLPSIVFLESQGYRPPARLIEVLSGSGTAVAAAIGAAPMSLASLVLPILAGPNAGAERTRRLAAMICGAGLTLVGLFASLAAELPVIVPIALLLSLAGLALLPVLGQALSAVTRGPLRMGPLFAFAVAASDLTLFGLGPAFWALVFGVGVSLLLESGELVPSTK